MTASTSRDSLERDKIDLARVDILQYFFAAVGKRGLEVDTAAFEVVFDKSKIPVKPHSDGIVTAHQQIFPPLVTARVGRSQFLDGRTFHMVLDDDAHVAVAGYHIGDVAGMDRRIHQRRGQQQGTYKRRGTNHGVTLAWVKETNIATNEVEKEAQACHLIQVARYVMLTRMVIAPQSPIPDYSLPVISDEEADTFAVAQCWHHLLRAHAESLEMRKYLPPVQGGRLFINAPLVKHYQVICYDS